MDDTTAGFERELADIASHHQEQLTGHAPKAVTVVLSGGTLVVTLLEALTPAEMALARSPEGAAQVQKYHRQLFASSTDGMRQEIQRITGRQVRESAAEIETQTGTVIHAFTTGAMVQVYLLTPRVLARTGTSDTAIERANDDGLHVAPEADLSG